MMIYMAVMAAARHVTRAGTERSHLSTQPSDRKNIWDRHTSSNKTTALPNPFQAATNWGLKFMSLSGAFSFRPLQNTKRKERNISLCQHTAHCQPQ